LNDAKKAAKDAIDKMEDLSDADKTAAKANVDKATDISGVDTAKTDAQNLNDAKKAAKKAINEMGNLNNAQKDTALKAVVNATPESAVVKVQNTAQTTDDNMSDLSTDANFKNADDIKNSSNYVNADKNLKDAYDKAVENAKALLDKINGSSTGDVSTESAVVKAAKQAVDEALNALNGDSNLSKAKEAAKSAIDGMSNLSDADKTAAKANVDKATNISGVNTAKTDAQNLNDAKKAAKDAIDEMGNLNKAQKQAAIDAVNNDLKKAIEEANAKKSTTAYTQASDTKDFDKALNDADTLNSDNGDNEDADAVQKKIDALNNAKLDGEDQLANAKKNAIDAINKLNNLNKAQKQAAIDAVNKANTIAEIKPIVDNATNLDGKMGDLKKAIEEANAKKLTTAYTQASDTKNFDEALNNANTLNSDNGDNEDADAVQKKIDALNNAKLDGEDQLANAKKDAIDAINKLNNLNKAQKQAAIDAVNNAQTKDAIQPIVDNATNLDGKMGDLKKAIEEANAKKSTTAYTQASDTKDSDKALNDANTLNSDNGDNEDADAVQKKIDALNNAKLDGEKVALQKAIEQANAKIDGTNPDYVYYNSDSESQSALKDAVAKAKTLLEQRDASDDDFKVAREAIETAIKALNGQLTDKSALQKAASQSNDVHKSVVFLNASEAAKKAYEDALANAQTVLADENASQEDVDAALAKLNAALNKLDGKEAPAKPTVKKNTVKLGTNADRLPQTGSHKSVASELGLGILALGLTALGLAKKRKED